MKYLLIILLSFALACPALAAGAVKGSMPEVHPLQPPAPNVHPNYGTNIQASGPEITPGVQSQDQEQTATEQESLASPTHLAAGQKTNSIWVFILIVAGGAAFLWYKRKDILT